MKKNKFLKIIGASLGIVLVVIIAIIVIINTGSISNEKNSKSNEIMDNFYKYLESSKTKVIYLAGNKCSYCELETPIMKQIKEDYKLDYLYVNYDNLTEEDKKTVNKVLDIDGDIPTVAIVKDGEVEDVVEDYLEGKAMVQFLIENDVLKENAVYTPEQYLTNIDYSDYEEIISKGELSVVVIGQTTCSHCIAAKPVLSHIAGEYDIKINYLNITDINDDEQQKLIASLKEIGYSEADNLGTPLTIIVKDKKLVSKVEGENPPSYFIRQFKKAGVISE